MNVATNNKMAPPRRNIPINALRDMDLGLPVTAGGTEYIMIDKVFMRTPCFVDGKLQGHRLLGIDLCASSLMQMFAEKMSDEEAFTISSRAVMNPKINERHPTSQMLADLRKILLELQGKPIFVGSRGGVRTEESRLGSGANAKNVGGREVTSDVSVRLTGAPTFAIDEPAWELGATVDDFDIHSNCMISDGNGNRSYGSMYLAMASRKDGLRLNPAIQAALDATQNPSRIRQAQQESTTPSP